MISFPLSSDSILTSFINKPLTFYSSSTDSLKNHLVKFNECLTDIENKLSSKEEDYLSNVLEDFFTIDIESLMEVDKGLKLISCCTILDIIRILTIDNAHCGKLFNKIIKFLKEVFQEHSSLKEDNCLIQFYYIFDILEKSNFSKLFKKHHDHVITKDFINAVIECCDLAQKEPEINNKICRLLNNIITILNQIKDEDYEEILVIILNHLKKENKKSSTFDMLKNLIKDMSWNTKSILAEIINSLLKRRGKSRQDIKLDHLMFIISTIFKIDYEILLTILPTIENEIKEITNKEIRKNYLTMIGKICSFKASKIGTLNQRFFIEVFVNSLTSKKNTKIRVDLLKYAFKYMKNFGFSKFISTSYEINSSLNYDKIKM